MVNSKRARQGKSQDTAKSKPTAEGKPSRPTAEAVEERRLTKGNSPQQTRRRTQGRNVSLQQALQRIRQAAERDKKQQFTSLWHHVYKIQHLEEAYYALKRGKSTGVDGVTWYEYGENLQERLEDLSDRLRRGAYRARPVRRARIPKPDGRERPIGIPALEDKLVQRATVSVLNAIYEADFLGFSYGFREKRSQHDALDALCVGLKRKKVNWVLDADIAGYFDAISHEWMIRFVEHRIADKRVVRHIKKWLKAGVLVDGRVEHPDEGTPQGGVISPLLANIYLHYVFDLWAHKWRRQPGVGDVMIVRFADDFVVGFQNKADAKRFQADLIERLRKFDLSLNGNKTKLIEFGRYATERRKERKLGKPDTFVFLGFTHYCTKSRDRGWFDVGRRTNRRRMQRKLRELKEEIRRRMHRPIPEVGKWLRSVLRGHTQYYGVPGNEKAMSFFRMTLVRYWHRTLSRRSQKGRVTWRRMTRLIRKYLPTPQVVHEYPEKRFAVTHPR